MNKIQERVVALAVAGAALVGLQGCGTAWVSKGLTDDGRVSEPVFPDIQKDAWMKDGTFPNTSNLHQVASGMSKDQLQDLLGKPHFNEGLVDVREWDYVFNLRTGQGPAFITCQYKVIFDSRHKAQSFHWQPASCAGQ